MSKKLAPYIIKCNIWSV